MRETIKKRYIKKMNLLKNNNAVIGLPVRLTVSLIIGAAALSLILFYILNPCIFPKKMVVSVDPMVNIIPKGKNQETFSIKVIVKDDEGYPVKGASILIKGLGDIASNNTNKDGLSYIEISPELDNGVHEGYLDITIKAQCLETFSQSKYIKVVRELWKKIIF